MQIQFYYNVSMFHGLSLKLSLQLHFLYEEIWLALHYLLCLPYNPFLETQENIEDNPVFGSKWTYMHLLSQTGLFLCGPTRLAVL